MLGWERGTSHSPVCLDDVVLHRRIFVVEWVGRLGVVFLFVFGLVIQS